MVAAELGEMLRHGVLERELALGDEQRDGRRREGLRDGRDLEQRRWSDGCGMFEVRDSGGRVAHRVADHDAGGRAGDV